MLQDLQQLQVELINILQAQTTSFGDYENGCPSRQYGAVVDRLILAIQDHLSQVTDSSQIHTL
jgi:hypothetical protein